MNINLSADDIAMRKWTPMLRDELRIVDERCNYLATTLFTEICSIPEATLDGMSDVLSYADRFNEVACFINCLAQRQAEGNINNLEHRAHLVLSNYMCFVYLGDACFLRMRKLVPNTSVARRCFEYLTDNPVRAFRNAIAHANWKVSDATVAFWARKGEEKNEPLSPFIVRDLERQFWFYLTLCVGKSTFAALSQRSPQQ